MAFHNPRPALNLCLINGGVAMSGPSGYRPRSGVQRAALHQQRADQLRRLAAEEANLKIRTDLLGVADLYQAMADKLLPRS